MQRIVWAWWAGDLRRSRTGALACGVLCATLAIGSFGTATAVGAVVSAAAGGERAGTPEKGTAGSLEAAAAKAGDTGRAVAMSLIGLAFAVAATVLAFRRDFKEAAGVFAVGIVSILLATPAGVNLLRDTVSSIFGA
ncbi:MAG TPA: hypothetical protein VGX69_12015 [Solirubrobacteraceae bacterium]|jgi:hypothetical protein|nr:hypothetical protein [Solirubrobacteraceae bacterium]